MKKSTNALAQSLATATQDAQEAVRVAWRSKAAHYLQAAAAATGLVR